MLETIRRCQGQLAVLASGEQGAGLGPGAGGGDRRDESRSLEVFLGDLQTLWQTSQPRRRRPRPRTGKRSRPDPFEPDVGLIEGWLQAVTARKDDAPAAVQAAIANVAVLAPFSGGGGLIQTTSG